MIDENNYESYFLDFREGNLTEREVELLMQFLSENPQLEDSLLRFEPYIIESKSEPSLNKKFLLKSLDDFRSINDSNFDEFCVAYYEQDLSNEVKQDLFDYIKDHPEKSRDFENYGKVYLRAHLNLKYPFKSKLKKFTLLPIYRIAYIISSAAAILLLILYLIPFTQQLNRKNKQSNSIKTYSIREIQNKPQTRNSEVRIAQSGQNIHKILSDLKANQISSSSESPIYKSDTAEKHLLAIHTISISHLTQPINSGNIDLVLSKVKTKTTNEKAHYLSLKEFAIEKLLKAIDPNLPESAKINKLTWWDLARLGVSELNKLTGNEVKVDRKIDEEGKVVAMVIESGNLSFTRSVSK